MPKEDHSSVLVTSPDPPSTAALEVAMTDISTGPESAVKYAPGVKVARITPSSIV